MTFKFLICYHKLILIFSLVYILGACSVFLLHAEGRETIASLIGYTLGLMIFHKRIKKLIFELIQLIKDFNSLF